MSGDPAYMNINFETLQQAQDDLGAAYAAIQATIDELNAQLRTNLSQWSGSAQDSYARVRLQWQQALDHMNGVLRQAHVHLANAAEMYQAVESQNVSIWNG
jgi:ESAT-6 family protein